MKILVTTTLNRNLTEAKMKPLIALDEVDRIFYITDRPGPKLDKVRYYCVPKFVLKVFNNNPAVRVFFKLYMVFYLAAFKRPDLLTGYSFMPHGINAALAGWILNIPSCIHVIGSVPSVEGGGVTCGNNALLKALKRSCLFEKALLNIAKQARLITVTGTNTKDFLISRGMNKENIKILPSAVDTARFFQAHADKEYDIITIGELIPSKRIDMFLEIISGLKKGLNLKAVILGEGPLRAYLEGLAKTLGLGDAVYFAGFHPDVEEYLNRSKIFLMTTESEGLSLAMLEAMACGVVPVVSNVGDLSDAIDDGVNGRLIAKDDIDAFCAAVYNLLNDKKTYGVFSKNAIETIKRHHATQNAAEKWRRILGIFMKPKEKPSNWLFNRLKAMSFQEIAHRLIRALRAKMFGLGFLSMTKGDHLSRKDFNPSQKSPGFGPRNECKLFSAREGASAFKPRGSTKPRFFIDDNDIDFIRRHMKENKADIILPDLKKNDCETDTVLGNDIKRRMGFSRIEAVEIWRVNRFQWLTAYAQKYAIDKDEDAAEKAKFAIKGWIEKNPVLKGINWMDSLEISMRLLSWAYVYFLMKDSKTFDKDFEATFLRSIYCQIRCVEANLSRYSSANNHLIGEAVGLFAIGVLFPQLIGSEKRLRLGKSILEKEIKKQVYPDGVSKEQSTHYHEFVTELYIIAVILGRRNDIYFSADLNSRLEKMCEFIMHMTDDSFKPLHIGDSDDGVGLKLNMLEPFSNLVFILNTASVLFKDPGFKRYGDGFDEKSLWLLGYEGYAEYLLLKPKHENNILASKGFSEGGYYIIRHKDLCLHFDCGQLGYLSLASHGHADSLSFTLSIDKRHIFIDPGTYLYHSGNKWRDYFRGTSGHSTVRIDGLDQSEARGPFLWGYKAKSYLRYWVLNGGFDKVCGYHTGYGRLKDPVVHSREIILDKLNEKIVISDSIVSKGRHYVEQFFHLHPDCSLKRTGEHLFEISNGNAVLTMETDKCFNSDVYKGSDAPIAGWYSDKFGKKQESFTVCNKAYSNADKSFITKIYLSNLNKLGGKEK